ncbi:MAG: hypothetical protein ABJB76_06185 [Candidatus Nitrosocosmicus sp.]
MRLLKEKAGHLERIKFCGLYFYFSCLSLRKASIQLHRHALSNGTMFLFGIVYKQKIQTKKKDIIKEKASFRVFCIHKDEIIIKVGSELI